jgi:hypothetical protein
MIADLGFVVQTGEAEVGDRGRDRLEEPPDPAGAMPVS